MVFEEQLPDTSEDFSFSFGGGDFGLGPLRVAGVDRILASAARLSEAYHLTPCSGGSDDGRVSCSIIASKATE